MNIKPWREIVLPRKEVLEGTFRQSEFAADISQVVAGNASSEYQDAEQFFARTFITEGMRQLLISVAQRLAGQGGEPVIQLQTAFGGGKTHTMLAVYHMAGRKVASSKLEGIPIMLDRAGITELPRAKVAVLDGNALSPSQAVRHDDGLSVNTLWGELAWQLAGQEGYEKVAPADQDGTSPGKNALIELLRLASPCVILIDELLAFIRQLAPGRQYKAGTFDSNLSFIQALTEAVKSVENAVLLATLPESDLETGGSTGRRALRSLEKFFGRLEAIWKPVGSEEAFEIVRRRLFDSVGDSDEVNQVCATFARFYRRNKQKFPPKTDSDFYEERLRKCYPIHPEVFDRLYEDWSTLENFQRTRGVLQYLAMVIHCLWAKKEDYGALLMPGSLPLHDTNVRDKSIQYLAAGWTAVLEKEIDGEGSTAANIDRNDGRFGRWGAARRVARTIFLGSAPSTRTQTVRGIDKEHILLGAVQPNQKVGVMEDVLARLRDTSHHLYGSRDDNRCWFDTAPNLRREVESRKQQLNTDAKILPELTNFLKAVLEDSLALGGIHIFTPSQDIPDDVGKGPRLVVLEPSSGYSRRQEKQLALVKAKEILDKRGGQPRENQNRLIFLALDFDDAERLLDKVRTFLAWKSIQWDFDSRNMEFQAGQQNEVKHNLESSRKALQKVLREAYKWLICPLVKNVDKDDLRQPQWDAVVIQHEASLTQDVVKHARDEGWLIDQWAPLHLKSMLNDWYFKEGTTEVSALQVWKDCCRYLYLPRLKSESVFREVVQRGLQEREFFGFAEAREGDRYHGFVFGSGARIRLDEDALLIEHKTAAKYYERTRPAPPEATQMGVPGSALSSAAGGLEAPGGGLPHPHGSSSDLRVSDETGKTRFYGTVVLGGEKAKMDFSSVVDEVIQPFTTEVDVEVKISVEIEAKAKNSFAKSLQRIVTENCGSLGFKACEFDKNE